MLKNISVDRKHQNNHIVILIRAKEICFDARNSRTKTCALFVICNHRNRLLLQENVPANGIFLYTTGRKRSFCGIWR